MGQIAETLQTRAPGQFPSQAERKSQAECKAIFLRSEERPVRDPVQDVETKDEKVDQVEVIMRKADTSLEEVEHTTVALTEECSAIIQHKIPPKLEDPGSFTIPIRIGKFEFDKALCDLGASVNLMPLSIFRKLGLGEVQPTFITLQLADRSIIYPYGMIKDVLVKVDKFHFPADFLVLDIDDDQEIPIILGRPFLATGGAIIDVKRGKLTLQVDEEEAVFSVVQPERRNSTSNECYRVDVVNPIQSEPCNQQVLHEQLMKVLTEDGTIPDKDRPSRKGSTFGSNKQRHEKVIVPGMEVLLLNPRYIFCPGNLISNWSGPFKVSKLFPDGKVEIEDKDGATFKVNDHHVKPYLGEEMLVTNTTFRQKPSK
jgi:hypothetical protein